MSKHRALLKQCWLKHNGPLTFMRLLRTLLPRLAVDHARPRIYTSLSLLSQQKEIFPVTLPSFQGPTNTSLPIGSSVKCQLRPPPVCYSCHMASPPPISPPLSGHPAFNSSFFHALFCYSSRPYDVFHLTLRLARSSLSSVSVPPATFALGLWSWSSIHLHIILLESPRC